MSEPVLDLRSTLAVLRRRSRVLVAAGVLGLAAGGAVIALQPPRLGSTTLVLIPATSGGSSGGEESQTIPTQVRIAQSTTVLGRAGQSVRPVLSARAVLRKVEITAPTDHLIEIQAFDTRGTNAQRLSRAVADAYVAVVKENARTVTAAALGDLYTRERDLQDQVTALQGEIAATLQRQRQQDPDSSEGRREAQLLAQLRAEQADVSLRLDKVKDDIVTGMPLGSISGTGTAVIQAPSAPIGQPLVLRLVTWGPLAMLLGVALAALAILVAARRDPRLRLRNEISDAVGSTVLAAVQSRPQRSVAGWTDLLASYDARPVDAWAFRQVLRALVPPEARNRGIDSRPLAGRVEHPRSLTAISLSGDPRGLAVGVQLAGFAASIGIVTRLVAVSGQESAAQLWAAFTADRPNNPRPGLVVGEAHPDAAVDLTISLVVVDRRQPSFMNPPRTTSTLFTVAAAAATEEELAGLAVAVDDAGRRIDGIVIADPDRTDRTTGRHTLDERARQAALPTRLTGAGPDDVRIGDRNRSGR